VTLSADCGANKFGEMSLEVAGTTLPVDPAGLAKTGTGYSGTKTLTTNAVTTRALDNKSVPNPVALCTDDLAALVKSGAYGKAQKGWARQFDNALPATLSLRCSAPNTKKGGFEQPGALLVEKAETRFPVWVHCGPAAVFRPDDSKPNVPAKRSSDIDPKSEPQRVSGPPQRTGGAPQRVAGSAGPEALPDLIVAAAQPAPTAPSKLRVQIANKGTGASPATKLTLFYHRSGQVMKVQADVPALHAGEARWIIVDAGSPLSYASQITLRVDDPPGVTELDEGNNAFTVK
jgi:hypothetical protein